MRTSLSGRRDLKSSFHHSEGPVELVQTSLGVSKVLESIFHHRGSPVKPGQGSSCTLKAFFTTVEVL